MENMNAWIQDFMQNVMADPEVGTGTAGSRGFSLEFNGKEWTLKAWTNDSFAWSGESSSADLAALPALFDEENVG